MAPFLVRTLAYTKEAVQVKAQVASMFMMQPMMPVSE